MGSEMCIRDRLVCLLLSHYTARDIGLLAVLTFCNTNKKNKDDNNNNNNNNDDDSSNNDSR